MAKSKVCVSESEEIVKSELGGGWDPPGCPFLFLGDDDAAENDLKAIKRSAAKVKKFFSQLHKH